jgi:hypothetical protein
MISEVLRLMPDARRRLSLSVYVKTPAARSRLPPHTFTSAAKTENAHWYSAREVQRADPLVPKRNLHFRGFAA